MAPFVPSSAASRSGTSRVPSVPASASPAQLTLPWRDRVEVGTPEPAAVVPSGPPPEPGLPPTVTFVRNLRARRYILRVLPDSSVRVTIPRNGSRREAEAFVRTRTRWIDDRRREIEAARRQTQWVAGELVWWRGERRPVEVTSRDDGAVLVRCGDLEVLTARRDDYRPVLEPLMRRHARVELPGRLLAMAERFGLAVARITVRNQRSRWGSCSREGNIALNWRLLQMPAEVCDYVLAHELMHLHEPNHSPRFWARVAAVCPDYARWRTWLRHEGLALC